MMGFKLSFRKNAMNWELFDIGRELERMHKRLRRLENPKNLMEVAIMQGNKEMWRKHMDEVFALKKEIKEKEAEYDALAEKIKEEKSKKETKKHFPHEEEEEPTPIESMEEPSAPMDWEEDEPPPASLDFGPTDLEEFDFADDMQTFADISDYLDKKGFFDAANIIDDFMNKRAEKREEDGRKEAKTLRLKRLGVEEEKINLPYLFERHEERLEEEREKAKEKPVVSEESQEMEEEEDISGSEYDLLDLFEGEQEIDDICASLNIEKKAQPNLEGLTEEQKRRVKAIRNPGLANQWANYLRRQNVRARQPQQKTPPASQPVKPQAPASQPVKPQAPASQPTRKQNTTGLRDPKKFQEYMRKLYGPTPPQRRGPQQLTQKDFPQALKKEDFPQELTEKDFPKGW